MPNGLLARCAVAMLATAAVVIAAVLILSGSASGGQAAGRQAVAGSDGGVVATTLGTLHPPPGFHRDAAACRIIQLPGVASVCFTRARSIPLNRAVMARLVTSTGATMSQPEVPCPTASNDFDRPPLRVETCGPLATYRRLHLELIVESVVRVDGDQVASTTRPLGTDPGGTQIELNVNGISN
jgi:hypothetical protein